MAWHSVSPFRNTYIHACMHTLYCNVINENYCVTFLIWSNTIFNTLINPVKSEAHQKRHQSNCLLSVFPSLRLVVVCVRACERSSLNHGAVCVCREGVGESSPPLRNVWSPIWGEARWAPSQRLWDPRTVSCFWWEEHFLFFFLFCFVFFKHVLHLNKYLVHGHFEFLELRHLFCCLRSARCRLISPLPDYGAVL